MFKPFIYNLKGDLRLRITPIYNHDSLLCGWIGYLETFSWNSEDLDKYEVVEAEDATNVDGNLDIISSLITKSYLIDAQKWRLQNS
jgi:hypothetical protein